ncbi:VOC family protein [Micromonospora sp. M12]
MGPGRGDRDPVTTRGTKVAWGGPPLAPKGEEPATLRPRPPGGDQQAEVDRLLALGATRVEIGADGVVMLADPDGNEFCVSGQAVAT